MIAGHLLRYTAITELLTYATVCCALGFLYALQLPRSDDKMGGTKSSEIKEVNEFREKITKFPNFPNLLKFFIRGKTSSVVFIRI